MSEITTGAALGAALDKCVGGETIELGAISAPVRIIGRKFDKPVTLGGGSITLVDPATVEYQPVLALDGCSNLALDSVNLSGVGADQAQRGFGLSIVGGSSNISATGCAIQRCARGIILTDTSFVTLARNDLSAIRSDGIDIVASSNIDVVANQMSGFTPYLPGDPALDDHPDGIQFWTKGAKAGCARVRLINNLIVFSPDARGQGIFGGDDDLGYSDFTIEDNLIIAPLWNAILFGKGATGLKLNRNTVLNVPGGPAVPGGPVRPSIKVMATATLNGNSAPAWAVTDAYGAVTYGAPIGNASVTDITQGGSDGMVAAWRGLNRPQAAPPIVVPPVAPTPVPAPSIDVSTMRAKLAKATAEVTTATNDVRRANTAVTAATKALDELVASLAAQGVRING